MKKLLLYILRISALCCICSFTTAQPDAELPVHIISDKVNFDNRQGVATYYGHVTVNQGTRQLQADKLFIFRDANNEIKEMIASGKPAVFRSHENPHKPPGSGTADTIKYYPHLNKVDLINNASLTQDGDTVSGPMLTYNFATEELEGNSSTQQRTTVILQPKRVP